MSNASAASLDAEAAKEYFAPDTQQRDTNVGYAATAFGWGRPAERRLAYLAGRRASTARCGCWRWRRSSWAASSTSRFRRRSRRPQLLPSLENGQQFLLPGFGHSTDYWDYQPEASGRLINTFFASGEVDDSLYRPQPVDFTPEVTLPALAKGIAGTMVGLALVAIASLLWMAHRVRKRGESDRRRRDPAVRIPDRPWAGRLVPRPCRSS